MSEEPWEAAVNAAAVEGTRISTRERAAARLDELGIAVIWDLTRSSYSKPVYPEGRQPLIIGYEGDGTPSHGDAVLRGEDELSPAARTGP